jgi:hypothetical protein
VVEMDLLDKLISLNFELNKIPKEKLIELCNSLEETGYEWDASGKCFTNYEIRKSIKVESLHIFDAESIRNEWGNPKFISEYSSKLFLTKFIFLGFPIALLISVITLFLEDWIEALINFGFFLITFFLVEQSRKHLLNGGRKGLNPNNLSTIFMVCFLVLMLDLFLMNGEIFPNVLLPVSGVFTLLFFFKFK